MAKIDFPVATVDGQIFVASTNVIYTYVGNPPAGYWSAYTGEDSENLNGYFVKVAGDNMTGDLTLGTDKITLDAVRGVISSGTYGKTAGTEGGYLWQGSGSGSQLSLYSNTTNEFAILVSTAPDSATAKTEKFTVQNDGELRIGNNTKDGSIDGNINIRLYNSGASQFAGDMAIGITGSFTPSTPAITLYADGLASFAGGDVAIEKHSSNDNKRINLYSGDTTQGHASFGTFDSVNNTYTNRLNHNGSAQFLSYSAPTDAPGFSINENGLIWKSAVADAGDDALRIYSGPSNITTNVTAKIANNGNIVTVGDIQSTSQNGGALAGSRNLIINGDFRVWQRGTSVDVAGARYTADRWFVSSGSETQAVSRANSTLPGFAYEANFNSALGSIFQGIELDRFGSAEPFTPGSTWTFSCWVRYRDISALNFVARFNANGVGTGTDSTPVVNTPFGAAVETAPNSWNKHVVTFTIPDPLTLVATPNCLEIVLAGGGAAGGLIRYTGVQLEPGPVATPFEHRSIGTELALCQRYYQSLNLNSTGRYGGTSRSINLFGVPMRVRPTSTHPESVNGCRGLIAGGTNAQETILANSLSVSSASSTPGVLYAAFGGLTNHGTTTTTLPCGLFVPDIELDAEF